MGGDFMTNEEIEAIATRMADIMLTRMVNNCRCKLCGWVGPRSSLTCIIDGRLACPSCLKGTLLYGEVEESVVGFPLPLAAIGGKA